MSDFKKLKDGGIIFVKKISAEPDIVQGYSLKSPTLNEDDFPFSEIDQGWDPNLNEILVAFKTTDRSEPPSSAQHSLSVTLVRIAEVQTAIQQMVHKKFRTQDLIQHH